MNAGLNVFGACAEYIKDLATSISETFTGADSGAVLIMIIFYLAVLIIAVLLLRVLFKIINSCFNSWKHKTKRGPSTKHNSGVTAAKETAPDRDWLLSDEKPSVAGSQINTGIDSFDGQGYLDLLSLKYNKINDLTDNTDSFQPLTAPSPQLLVVDGIENNKGLTSVEKEEIAASIKNKSLIELNTLLAKINKESAEIGKKITVLSESLAIHYKNRENLVQEEFSVLDKYNAGVNDLSSIRGNFESEKVTLSLEYSKLFNFISEIITQKDAVLEIIKQINNNISSVPEKVEAYSKNCESSLNALSGKLTQQQELLKTLKSSYATISDSRVKKDEEISSLQQTLSELVKKKAVCDETVDALQLKINELTKLEAEEKARLEAEQKAREEAERAARLEAERREKERIAKEQAEKAAKLEAERKAREEAERIAKEELEKKQREEAERLAREEALRIEKEKQLAEKRVDSEVSSVDEAVTASAGADESVDPADLNAVKEQIQKQAQNSYSLNFEDITPEMVEKIARSSQKRKTDILKAVKHSPGPADNEKSKPVKTEQEPQKADLSIPVSGNESAEDSDNTGKKSPAPEKDYMAEIKQRWAAEKAHKEQWAAEQKQKKAEEERRKKELLMDSVNESESDT